MLKPNAMKSTGVVQIITVLLLVASAASCEVAKEYSSRVFKPTAPIKKTDSTATALRFMEFDSDNASDSISLKDLANSEINEPVVAGAPKDSVNTETVIPEARPVQKQQPVDGSKRGTARTRKIRQ
jgi:hypothetical protein